MKHKTFEEWIFLDELPDQKDQKALYDHLRECDECFLLEKHWREIESLMISAPIAGPANGFADRWQARLALDRRRTARRQNLAVFALTSAGAALFMILFGLQFSRQIADALSPPAFWLTSAGHYAAFVLERSMGFGRFLFEASPASFSMLAVMLVCAALATTALFWLKMFRTLARVHGVTQWA